MTVATGWRDGPSLGRNLNAGDSFYFPSNLPHAYRDPGKTRLRVVWINTPPTF